MGKLAFLTQPDVWHTIEAVKVPRYVNRKGGAVVQGAAELDQGSAQSHCLLGASLSR